MRFFPHRHVGSPALAAYSLQITQPNAPWLTKVFSDIEYPGSEALLRRYPQRFQHYNMSPPSFRLTPSHSHPSSSFPSTENIGDFSRSLPRRSDDGQSRLLSTLSGSSFPRSWTTIDTYYTPAQGKIGYGMVTGLAYLLPLVIGWLHVGSEPVRNHPKDFLKDASKVP